MTKNRLGAAGTAALLVCAWGALGQETQLAARELADLSLEQLANIEVHLGLAARGARSRDAPASIYVITADDIRRSGATSLPEALRLAPNLQVARADANQYAISARGFNNALANKLLVLIDGRTVYTPLFSGVFWDAQDVMLEDVERIEVISGPGATLWGANAVNGVINVITQPAPATRRARSPPVGAGNHERGAAARYGGTARRTAHYRVYAKTLRRDNTATADGDADPRRLDAGQAGFRADWGAAPATASRCRATPTAARSTRRRRRASSTGANLLGALDARARRGRRRCACRPTTTTPSASTRHRSRSTSTPSTSSCSTRLRSSAAHRAAVGRRLRRHARPASRTSPRSPSCRPTAR